MNDTTSIIIVHWNTPLLLDQQLKTLTEKTNDIRIIVVDNASEKPIDTLQKKYPGVEWIMNPFNRGYASACNQGALRAKGKWLLFLNPDVEITSDHIQEMIKEAEMKQFDACSIQTTSSYQKPLPNLFSLLTEFTPLHRIITSRTQHDNFTLFGGCLFIKKDVFKRLGGWDERFFVWFEDSDLTLRLLKNNYKIGWLPLRIKHCGGQSFNRLTDQMKRDLFFYSMEIYAKKHFSFLSQQIISIMKGFYSQRKTLPVLRNNLVSMTIPNMKKTLLKKFFKDNAFILHNTWQVEWIVVTSSVENKNVWEWRRWYPDIRFIPIERNKGFAHTVNVGLRASTGKLLGTVNDDVVFSPDWISQCASRNKSDDGSINPVIRKKNGEIETAGIKILEEGRAIPQKTIPSKQSFFKTDATNAACVLYSKEALNIVGLFDEKFHSYLEDIDLSLRLSRAGFENLVCTKTSVIHKGQSTSPMLGAKKQWLDFQNWIYIILKNWGIKKIALNLIPILLERGRNISGILKKFF